MAPTRGVGGQGKPVRIRRGPATVTGNATARATRSSHWTAVGRSGRRGSGDGPGARRPAAARQARMPSWKGVAPDEKTLHRPRGDDRDPPGERGTGGRGGASRGGAFGLRPALDPLPPPPPPLARAGLG